MRRTTRGLLAVLGITLAKVAAFIAIVLCWSVPASCPGCCDRWRERDRASFSRCAFWRSHSASHSVRPELFGVSFALGAFFAGMVLHESDLSHKAATNSLPLQDAFAVLFFVSVGMLFDPSIILREP